MLTDASVGQHPLCAVRAADLLSGCHGGGNEQQNGNEGTQEQPAGNTGHNPERSTRGYEVPYRGAENGPQPQHDS